MVYQRLDNNNLTPSGTTTTTTTTTDFTQSGRTTELEHSASVPFPVSAHQSVVIRSRRSTRCEKDDPTSNVPTPKKKYTTQQWLALITLAYGNFAIGACVSLQAPFFPQMAESKGSTPTQYGLMFGIYELVMFVVAPICGKLIGIVPSKFMLNAGIFLVGCASILFGVLDRCPAGVPFIALAFAIRIFEGMASAMVKTSSYTITAVMFPGNIATTFAILETCLGLGLIAGPTIGGALYELGGYEMPFIMVGAFLLIDAVIIYFALPPSENFQSSGSGNMLKFYAHPAIILDFLMVFSSFVCIGWNQATLEPHLREFNLTPIVLGCVFIINGATYAMSSPGWGWLCDKGFNPKIMNAIGCGIMIIEQLLVGPAPFFPFKTELWLIILSLMIFGISVGAKLVCTFVGALQDTMERGFPDDMTTYGLVSSMFASSQALGAFVGPSVGGMLLDTIGYRPGTMVLLGEEIILFVAVTFYAVWSSRRRNNPPKNSQIDLMEKKPLIERKV